MSDHYQTEKEIEAVVQGFESCTTARDDFRHREHLTVAVWYLRNSTPEQAFEKMRSGLFRFLDHHGVGRAKYKEALTLSWLKLIQSVIEQMDSGPVMKLRHFSPGNIGWEEKEKPYEYPLMFLEPDKARFERPDKKTALTFYRTAPDKLKVILERQDKDGRWVEDVFDYSMAK